MVLTYGGSLWWCIVFLDPRGSWKWAIWGYERVRIRGKEGECRLLLGVTRKVYAKVMWLCGQMSMQKCVLCVDFINMLH